MGAQKNFGRFAQLVGREFKEAPDSFNDGWFRRAVAKAVLFRAVEGIVSRAPWYTGGLRANTVTYAIAKVVHDARSRGLEIDLRRVWDDQEAGESLRSALDAAAERCHAILLAPPSNASNPTEWAKKQACWKAVSEAAVVYPSGLDGGFVSASDARGEARDDRRDHKELTAAQAQIAAFEMGAERWSHLHQWARANSKLTPTEDGILRAAARAGARPISEKQAVVAMAVLGRMTRDGYVV